MNIPAIVGNLRDRFTLPGFAPWTLGRITRLPGAKLEAIITRYSTITRKN